MSSSQTFEAAGAIVEVEDDKSPKDVVGVESAESDTTPPTESMAKLDISQGEESDPEETAPEETEEFALTAESYEADGKAKTYGTENPSIMRKAFWKYMVHTQKGPDHARAALDAETAFHENSFWGQMTKGDPKSKKLYTGPKLECPIWCFDRLLQTVTQLADGRRVYIGGEYEDDYDPDFFIYNDVVVVDTTMDPSTPKAITIYGYPLEVFPAIDAHTATFYAEPGSGKEYIYIIGGMRDSGGPHREATNIYRLDLTDFSIKKMETVGAKLEPLRHHKAELVRGNDGLLSMIKITTSTFLRNCGIVDSSGSFVEKIYSLDLPTLTWSLPES